jgi:serine/threonine-protein phosphatase PGAM5
MAKRYLTLVRHGQLESDDGADALGPKLTELGWRQAHQAARRLASLPVDVIHTSSLRRAMETAQVLAIEHPNIPIRPSRLLWECIPALPDSVIQWVGHQLRLEQAEDGPPAEMQPWLAVLADIEDSSTLDAGFQQAREAWQKYFIPARGKDRHDILVCHGNLIRYFAARAMRAAPETWINLEIYNCSISEIVMEASGRSMLVSYNDSGHLLPAQKTIF